VAPTQSPHTWLRRRDRSAGRRCSAVGPTETWRGSSCPQGLPEPRDPKALCLCRCGDDRVPHAGCRRGCPTSGHRPARRERTPPTCCPPRRGSSRCASAPPAGPTTPSVGPSLRHHQGTSPYRRRGNAGANCRRGGTRSDRRRQAALVEKLARHADSLHQRQRLDYEADSSSMTIAFVHGSGRSIFRAVGQFSQTVDSGGASNQKFTPALSEKAPWSQGSRIWPWTKELVNTSLSSFVVCRLTPTRCRPARGKRLRIRACDFCTSKIKRAAPHECHRARICVACLSAAAAELVVIAYVIVPTPRAKAGTYTT
jgi:hypothetical protein